MTAIILAGRSGSAFAAEIGTMKVNEEIDALITMGLDPVRFLVVPRLIAAFLLCPLLTVLADLIGLVGGALVMRELRHPAGDLLPAGAERGHVRRPVRRLGQGVRVRPAGGGRRLPAWACKTGEGPSAVGQSTTRAVVGGIILIVVADGVFAVIFQCPRHLT